MHLLFDSDSISRLNYELNNSGTCKHSMEFFLHSIILTNLDDVTLVGLSLFVFVFGLRSVSVNYIQKFG